jgi:hypothetical protein
MREAHRLGEPSPTTRQKENPVRKVAFVPLVAIVILATGTMAYADCTCRTARVANGWCQDCKVGYVDGVKISSKKLYEALEGKSFTTASEMKCKGCKEAFAKDGVCEHCHIGFANKSAYRAMPAYCLARGEAKDPAEMKCPQCKAYVADHGWCDHCNVGMVGNRAFKDKEAYAEAVKAREVLLAAVKAATKCETCAVAMVTDGTCASCKISFEDGKPVTKSSEKEPKPATP